MGERRVQLSDLDGGRVPTGRHPGRDLGRRRRGQVTRTKHRRLDAVLDAGDPGRVLAQFAGLWAYGRLREPGLFAREFRQLRLGRVIAWLLVAAFAVSLVAQRVFAPGWQAADDVVFVLAAAFLVQALAVVHGLRELQVIGVVPLALAYLSILALPSLLVAIGLVDTWLKFRERFVKG